MKQQGLYNKLIEYSENGRYPFHMPGHKRRSFLNDGNEMEQRHLKNHIPYGIDITEIEGFDDLHHSEGIIQDSMDRASKFFGTDRTWFLVNGSSCGLLAAINAVTNIGDSIIIGRNCHKAVYNAIEIRNLNATYVYPELITEYGINGGYNPEDIRDLLEECFKENIKNEDVEYCLENKLSKEGQVKAVVITSPSYEGIVSDIKEIAKIVHEFGAVLIVDEAHGAHLGINDNYPEPAYKCGADIVIESAHKTLPALTQTAYLHVCGDRVNYEKLRKCLAVYESSSPSYVLMASLDKCIDIISTYGKEKLEELLITIRKFRKSVNGLKHFRIVGNEVVGKYSVRDFDPSKILMHINTNLITGKDLLQILREKYNMEMEMCGEQYVLAMTSMCDDFSQIEKLGQALIQIDRKISIRNEDDIKSEFFAYKTIKNQKVLSIYDAINSKKQWINLDETEGKCAADYIYVYPPEIPIIVPGELINCDIIDMVKRYKKLGLNIKGIKDNKIQVIEN